MDLILEQSSKSFDGYQYVYSHERYSYNELIEYGNLVLVGR